MDNKTQEEIIERYNFYKKWYNKDDYLKHSNNGPAAKKFCIKMMEKYWNLMTDENQVLHKLGHFTNEKL